MPAEVSAELDALDAAVAAIAQRNFDALPPAVRLRALERRETAVRRQVASNHDVIAGLAKEDPAHVGGPVHKVVADWLRISCAEAARRLRDAEQLSPRLTVTGQELPPELPATAVAWRDGLLDGQHLRVIQRPSDFWRGKRPSCVLTSWRRWRTNARRGSIPMGNTPIPTARASAASPGLANGPTA